MHVLVVGAHGQIGQRIVRAMARSEHTSRAMIRDDSQRETLQALGANEIVVADLEDDCSQALEGCDAVIFTAGSGGHTSAEKTKDVDRNGAISIIRVPPGSIGCATSSKQPVILGAGLHYISDPSFEWMYESNVTSTPHIKNGACAHQLSTQHCNMPF